MSTGIPQGSWLTFKDWNDLSNFENILETPFWNDLLINSAKGDALMSFNCFIIFIGRLLGPMLLLAFRSEIRLFTSSTVVGVIYLEKYFLVVRMFVL